MAIGAVVLLIGTAPTRRRRSASTPVGPGIAARLILVGAGLAAYRFAFSAAIAARADRRRGLYLRRMGDSNSRGFYPNPLSKRAP